jgi:hypothetical protein
VTRAVENGRNSLKSTYKDEDQKSLARKEKIT